MFGKGNWAAIHFDPESSLENALKDRNTLLTVSQLYNRANCTPGNPTTIGINPYLLPRADDLGGEGARTEALDFIKSNPDSPDVDCFVSSIEDFSVDANLFAFWVVINKWEYMDDINSLRENHAYNMFYMPYKLLGKESKKVVDDRIDEVYKSSASRKQFPMFIDTHLNLVLVETVSSSDLEMLLGLLSDLGVNPLFSRWSFSDQDARAFFSQIVENSEYQAEFRERAKEIAAKGKGDIVKHPDPFVERLVSSFFAAIPTPSETVALSAPAQAKLSKRQSPITISTSDNMTTLIDLGAEVAGSSVAVFDAVDGKTTSLYTVSLPIEKNDTKTGFALIRGFNQNFDMRGVKATSMESVTTLWRLWYNDMINNLTDFSTNVGTGSTPFISSTEDKVV